MKTQAPYVGTGLERKVAIDSGAVITSKATGKVTYVDANRITVTDKNGVEQYGDMFIAVREFSRLNQRETAKPVEVVEPEIVEPEVVEPVGATIL